MSQRFTVEHLFSSHNVKFGDWPAMQAKMAEQGFTVLLSNLQGFRYDPKRDVYTAKFEVSSKAAEVKLSNDVALFMLEQFASAPYYWFLKMEQGVVTDAIAADLR